MPCSRVHALQRGLLEVGMHLDLIHGGHDGRHGKEPIEVLTHEVAHTDRAYSTIGEQLLQCPVGIESALEG